MLCALCKSPILDEVRKMIVKAETYTLHKKCLRKATQKDLIKAGIISPDDKSFWTRY